MSSEKKCFPIIRNGNILYFLGNSIAFVDDNIKGVENFSVEVTIKDDSGNVISNFLGECK